MRCISITDVFNHNSVCSVVVCITVGSGHNFYFRAEKEAGATTAAAGTKSSSSYDPLSIGKYIYTDEIIFS